MGALTSVTDNAHMLALPLRLPVQAANAGLFVSAGKGRHPTREIDSFELIFVRQGLLGIREREVSFDVHAGQTLLLWPGRLHGGTRDYPPDLHFYWIHFSLSAPEGARDAGGLRAVPQHASIHRPDRLTALFRQYLDDQESGQQDPDSASLLVMLMLSEITYAPCETTGVSVGSVMLAHRISSYIQMHFTQPISTSSIAAALDCNADYLGRAFSAVYHMTITEAIHRRRLRQACALLLDTHLPVERIARECGFDDAGYFRRIFRRHEGMSPLAYRRLYARIHINTR